MKKYNCKNIIFSSTCAVYGVPQKIPINENHSTNPINPYGRSKLMIEQIIKDYSIAYNFKYVFLRYFNASGADCDIQIGEKHNPETHLIPIILNVALGKEKSLDVFGSDYDTYDGSAIRDYVHVEDLAKAHLLAFKYLIKNKTSNIFNLGNGNGYSVLEIIKSASKITNKKIKFILKDRRVGDPDILISDTQKVSRILKWKPNYIKIEDIIKTAWNWHIKINE